MNIQLGNRLAAGERRFMERQQDVGHRLDLHQDVLRCIGIDVGARRDHRHLHGAYLLRWKEILVDDAKTGDGRRSLLGLHQYGHPAFSVCRGVHHAYTRCDLDVF